MLTPQPGWQLSPRQSIPLPSTHRWKNLTYQKRAAPLINDSLPAPHHHHHYSLGATEHSVQPEKEPVANAPLGTKPPSKIQKLNSPSKIQKLNSPSKFYIFADFSSPPSSRGVENSSGGGRTNGDFSSQQSSPSLRSDTSSSPVYQVSDKESPVYQESFKKQQTPNPGKFNPPVLLTASPL